VTPDWSAIRRDFPAAERCVYLNAAAASPAPTPVRDAVAAFYRELEEGGDAAWELWLARQEHVRVLAARLIGAEPDEVAFVDNASTGLNAIADLVAGDGAVLSDELEFPTLTLPWIHRGVAVHMVPAVEGIVRIESFATADSPKAATVCVSQVQFSNGCRIDLEAFGRIKERRSFVVGASQGLGAFPVDVKAAAIDALTVSGNKWLCAGYGAGFVYMSRELIAKRPPRAIGWLSVEEPFAFKNREYQLLPQAKRIELGCPNFAGVFALGAAIEYLLGIGVDAIAARILELNSYLTDALARNSFPVLSPLDEYRSGQTLCEVPEPGRAREFLRVRGILVTEKAEGLRISTHIYNNEPDVDRLIEALNEYRAGLL
jgi:selenocysteine lyase/cysteine desulfurase